MKLCHTDRGSCETSRGEEILHLNSIKSCHVFHSARIYFCHISRDLKNKLSTVNRHAYDWLCGVQCAVLAFSDIAMFYVFFCCSFLMFC